MLIDAHGYVKLCDFGSATVETYDVNDTWSAARRAQVEDELANHTTPMYRSPEMLELYMNAPIGPPLDVWVGVLPRITAELNLNTGSWLYSVLSLVQKTPFRRLGKVAHRQRQIYASRGRDAFYDLSSDHW